MRFLPTVEKSEELELCGRNWNLAEVRRAGGYDDALALTRDVLQATAAIVLAEAGQTRFVEALPRVSAEALASSHLQTFFRFLPHRAFARYALRELIVQTLAARRLNDPTRKALQSYLRPELRTQTITESDAAELWDQHEAFLDRWVARASFEPLPPTDAPEFFGDLYALADRATELLGAAAAFELLQFWIESKPTDRLETAFGDRMQQERDYEPDGGWIDYFLGFASDYLMALFIESAPELRFQWDRLQAEIARADVGAWLNDDVFERLKTATFNVDTHPAGSRVTQSAHALWRERGAVTTLNIFTPEEVLDTQRFLISCSRKQMLGHVAELIAMPLAIRAIRDELPPDATCIPGTAIRLSSGQQGPDGIIGTLSRGGTETVLRVHALIEVKGYDRRTAPELLEQLEKHERRIVDERLIVAHAGDRWVPHTTKKKSELTIDRVEIAGDVRLLAVVPGRPSGRRRVVARLVEISMPWTGEGLRAIALSSLVAIVRECGNKADVDQLDYSFGRKAWSASLRPVLSAGGLDDQDRASMEDFIRGSTEPNEFLLAAVLERNARKLAARRRRSA